MTIPKLDHERCEQRNRIAAKRGGVNAVPFRFLGDGPMAAPNMGRVAKPMSDTEALALINAARPGMEPLGPEDVFIHYAEAANSNFVPDRYCFLSNSTLRNIASNAADGFAFMNSHRTGDLSHPSELPYGRTFWGRYEAEGDYERSLVGFYMLARQGTSEGGYGPVYPNGQNGPSTADLHAGIDGGTIFDVSVGLYGGMAVCDVCGNDLMDYDACDHYPGTAYHMSEEEIAAQQMRGVPDGAASYTLDDAYCGEVSAVYDGAVPGAGFRKTVPALKNGRLGKQAAAQARLAYQRFLSKGEQNHMDAKDVVDAIREGFAGLGRQFRQETSTPPPAQPPAQQSPSAPPQEVTALQQQLADMQAKDAARDAEVANLKAQREADLRANQVEKNLARVDKAVKEFKILRAAQPQFERLAKGLDASDKPLDPAAAQAAFETTMAGIEANGAVTALVGNGPRQIPNDGNDVDDFEPTSQEGSELERLAREMQEKTGRSYIDCFRVVCKQHKDLAAAHFQTATGGQP